MCGIYIYIYIYINKYRSTNPMFSGLHTFKLRPGTTFADSQHRSNLHMHNVWAIYPDSKNLRVFSRKRWNLHRHNVWAIQHDTEKHIEQNQENRRDAFHCTGITFQRFSTIQALFKNVSNPICATTLQGAPQKASSPQKTRYELTWIRGDEWASQYIYIYRERERERERDGVINVMFL